VNILKILRREKGSATIEFLAMVPLVLFIMMVFWQFLVAGYAVIISQSAVNEAAKTYSVTGDSSKAEEKATAIINSMGGDLSIEDLDPNRDVDGNDFNMTLKAKFRLSFIPVEFVGVNTFELEIDRSLSGRVMD